MSDRFYQIGLTWLLNAANFWIKPMYGWSEQCLVKVAQM